MTGGLCWECKERNYRRMKARKDRVEKAIKGLSPKIIKELKGENQEK